MRTLNRPSPQSRTPTPNHAEPPHDGEAGLRELPANDGGQADLIERARAGAEDALCELFGRARPRALAVAFRMLRDRDDAEDAVQEAFIKVLRHLGRFEGRAAFGTWLHRIVVNTCLDSLRRREGRWSEASGGAGEEPHPAVEPVDPETPETRLDSLEDRRAVHRAMAALTPVHRQALSLRELDEQSYADIAHASRCPVGTVMSRLHHARRKLAAELQSIAGAERLPRAA